MLYRSKPKSLLALEGKERVRATLIFAPARKHKWLNYILKDGFAHVRVVIHKQYVSILVDPRTAFIDLDCFSSDYKVKARADETIIHYDSLVDIMKIRRVFGPLNCVEVVKGFLGIKDRTVLTPYQLYRWINGQQEKTKEKPSAN